MLRHTLRASLTLFILACCSVAQAQSFRAYLSLTGADANPCTLQQPCRLLPAALAAIADGGEVWILDSANYNTGPVTIGKSVRILAVPGAVGSIVAFDAGQAISIVASNLSVSLRNLVFAPFVLSPGNEAVNMSGASTLVIEHCLIAGLGINAVTISGGGRLVMNHTIVRNSGGLGVLLSNGASAEIAHSELLANGVGAVRAQTTSVSTTTASITDSIISGTGNDSGVWAYATVAGAVTRIFVTRTTIQGFGFGVASQTNPNGSTSLSLSGSMLVNNETPWFQIGANSVIRTLGNNHIVDNGAGSGVLTVTALQ
jgi:hypothetical protein